MARPAQIRAKTFPPLSLDHDGWFTANNLFGDGPRHFQMVPIGGQRFITVQVDGQPCVVSSRNATVAEVASIATGFNPTPENRVVLTPLAAPFPFVVRVLGKRVGRTQIVISDTSGTQLDAVEVSVKSEVRQTYRLWALKDLKRRTVRSNDQMVSVMRTVAAVYKEQANVKLEQIGGPEELMIKGDLGDPIVSPSLLIPTAAIAIKLENKTTANFDMVSTWNLEIAVGKTNSLVGVCLVADYKPGLTMQEASTYAHELCHAFGNGGHVTLPQMLMSGDGTDGLQMTRLDMDTINPTGLRV
jgi:hypothetical protein